ncbi:hypothetical protein [Dactylosporangium sp. NPDC051541]|uniref:hypothetical protein n=1 Tax=Dactylosporangium sp. NPDC051541 TaxID=3363977 RepID=UPI0037933F51
MTSVLTCAAVAAAVLLLARVRNCRPAPPPARPSHARPSHARPSHARPTGRRRLRPRVRRRRTRPPARGSRR